MNIKHDSHYPGLDLAQFYNLYQDNRYHDAVAHHGKVGREDVLLALQDDKLHSAWTCVVKRTLKGLHLDGAAGTVLGAKRMFPNGINIRWRESHTYAGSRGDLQMEMLEPKFLQLGFKASAEFEETPTGLLRRLDIEFSQPPMWLAPAMHIVAREIRAGMKKADGFTATWLREHAGEYLQPPAHRRDSSLSSADTTLTLSSLTLGEPSPRSTLPDLDSLDETESDAAYATASENGSRSTSYHSLFEQDLSGFSLSQQLDAAPAEPLKRAHSPSESSASASSSSPSSSPSPEALTLRDTPAAARKPRKRWRLLGACGKPRVAN